MTPLDWAPHETVRRSADAKYAAEVGPADIQEYDETMTNLAKALRSYGLDLSDPVVLHTMYGMLSVGVWLLTRNLHLCGPEAGGHVYAHAASYASSMALLLREQSRYCEGVPALDA